MSFYSEWFAASLGTGVLYGMLFGGWIVYLVLERSYREEIMMLRGELYK